MWVWYLNELLKRLQIIYPENFTKICYRLLATVGLYRPSFFLRWQPFLCLPWLFYPLVSHLSACVSSVISWLHHNFFLLNPSKLEGTIWNKSYCLPVSLSLWLSFFTLLSGMEIPRFALDSEVIFFSLSQLFSLFPCVELSLECCQKLSLSHHPPAVAKTLTHMPIAIQSFTISLNFSYVCFMQ